MIIGITGYARAGKTTVADYLVEEYGFHALSFATPVKDMLYELNPLVRTLGGAIVTVREFVDRYGWEAAKDSTYDVRPLLERLGTDCIRAHDEDFFCHLLGDSYQELLAEHGPGVRVVIPDVRFANEALWFDDGHAPHAVWHVTRPGAKPGKHSSANGGAFAYASTVLTNTGSLADLRYAVDRALESIVKTTLGERI